MKILDKYVAKNFLIGYFISFAVLIGIRIVMDLFVNLDEFAEHSDLGPAAVMLNIFRFYGYQTALYFRDFAGMITVIAAVFSLGKMTRNNELIAVMASGVSLKRVIAPIIILSILLTGLLIIDQEVIIPANADKLLRTHDELPGQMNYPVNFLEDQNNSLFVTGNYIESEQKMVNPMIILREKIPDSSPVRWRITGPIHADAAVYDSQKKGWKLINGRFFRINTATEQDIVTQPRVVDFYPSDIAPDQIPQMRKEAYKSLLSSHQLAVLASKKSRVKDLAELYSQKHFRITDPVISIIMLLVALPVLVCRDPKSMKNSIIISFSLTVLCFVITFVCKMFATEVFFNQVRPEIWAWLPILIFLPVALIELDAMKT